MKREDALYQMIVMLVYVSMFPFIYWMVQLGGMNWKIDVIMIIWFLLALLACFLPRRRE